MKRFEKMTKEEIVEFAGNCHTRGCEGCPALDVDGLFGTCMKKYLEQEIRMVPRYTLIKSDEDMDRITKEFETFCHSIADCEHCRIYGKRKNKPMFWCLAEYLKEQVEVEGEKV